jgi:propionate CoA-transferase
MPKIITADDAAKLIGDGMTVAFGTMGLAGWAEEIAQAVEKRFLETGHPNTPERCPGLQCRRPSGTGHHPMGT